MNRAFSDKISFFRRYLRYLRNSSTRYAIHSPYIYRLITEVIRPGSPKGICAPVEMMRENYLKDGRTILKTDWGSGADRPHPDRYEIRLKKLVRSSSLPPYRAGRLFNLVRFLDARNILELGTSLGISAGYMAKANPNATVVTLEGCPAIAALARENMSLLKVDKVRIVEGNFDTTLAEVLRDFKHLDLVFFDGNHRKGPTLEYFRQCLPLAHNETVFVFDDIHYSDEMEQAWEEIKSHERVTVSIDLFYMGWILFRKEISRQHFIQRYP